jgi:hypothetical protein
MKMDHRFYEQQLRSVAITAPKRAGPRAHLGLVLAALLAAALAIGAGTTAHPLPRHAVSGFSA